jgi:hypothetical protein
VIFRTKPELALEMVAGAVSERMSASTWPYRSGPCERWATAVVAISDAIKTANADALGNKLLQFRYVMRVQRCWF